MNNKIMTLTWEESPKEGTYSGSSLTLGESSLSPLSFKSFKSFMAESAKKEDLLAAAREFKESWWRQVTWDWIYSRMGLGPKGKKSRTRKDAHAMYYQYLVPELEKEWPAKTDVEPSTKRSKKQQAATGGHVNDGPDGPSHLGGQYGLVSVLGDGPEHWRKAIKLEKEQGVWGKITVREPAFIGNAGAGPSSGECKCECKCKCKCKCIVTVWQGELLRINRCNLLVRKKGCRSGSHCHFCHIHPVTAHERRQQPGRGYSKPERKAKRNQLSDDEWSDERETKTKDKVQAMSDVKKDFHGVFHLGKLVQTSAGAVSISVLSVGRNRDRAIQCAHRTEEALFLSPGTISLLLNYDFKNPSHYEPGSTMGRIALYDGMAKKILPLLHSHFGFKEAVWHIILEDACSISLKDSEVPQVTPMAGQAEPESEPSRPNVMPMADQPRTCTCKHPTTCPPPVKRTKTVSTSSSIVNDLAVKFAGASLCFLGFFSEEQHQAPPKEGTQMWAVRSDYLMELSADMQKTPASDLDMYFMWHAPGNNIAAASTSIAGQIAHWSDCNTKGKYFEEWPVVPQTMADLTCVKLEADMREARWLEYVEREQDLFAE